MPEANNNTEDEIGPNRRRTAIPLFIEGSDELGVESVEILHEIEVSRVVLCLSDTDRENVAYGGETLERESPVTTWSRAWGELDTAQVRRHFGLLDRYVKVFGKIKPNRFIN